MTFKMECLAEKKKTVFNQKFQAQTSPLTNYQVFKPWICSGQENMAMTLKGKFFHIQEK